MHESIRPVARVRATALVAACAMVSCAGPAMSLDRAGGELEGIYKIDSHSSNDGDCGAEGASVLEGAAAGFLAIYANEAMGQQAVYATACGNEQDCREKVGLSRAMGSYWTAFEVTFVEVDSQGGLRGEEISTGTSSMSAEEPCHGTVSENGLERIEGGIRIEQRSTVLEEFGKQGGRCTSDAARAAASSAACNRLTVITATRVAELAAGSSQ